MKIFAKAKSVILNKKKRTLLLYVVGTIIVITIILVLIISRTVSRRSKELVAIVNGEPVTIEEITAEFKNSPEFYRKYIQENPDILLEDYVNQVLLSQIAKKHEKKYKQKLNMLLKIYHREILIKEFLEQEIVSKIKISPEEIRKYYNLHLSEFVLPDRVRLHEIVVATREEAENILSRLSLGEVFENIARKESISQSRAKGGDLGWLKKGDIEQELEKIVFQMNPEQIFGKVVQTRMGYHLIKVSEKQYSRTQSIEEISSEIENTLKAQKKKNEAKKFLDELRKKGEIQVFMKNFDVIKEKLK